MTPEQLAAQFNIPEHMTTPPVEDWNPKLSGIMDLVIQPNGSWIHEGGKIERRELVRLFSSILKFESPHYYLVTPVEKWQITVIDTPLHITSVEKIDGFIYCTLLTGGVIELGTEHKLMAPQATDIAPAVTVRPGLTARFLRNAFYQLVELGEWGEDSIVLSSGSQHFQLPILDEVSEPTVNEMGTLH